MLPQVRKETLSFLWPIDWLGLHREYLQAGEMEIIAALLREVNAKSMIEIGCRDGRTARVLLHNVSSLERYVGIDVPMHYRPALPHQRNEMVAEPGHFAVADPRFELLISDNGSRDLTWDKVGPVDAMFIDGDHSFEVVLSDSHLADEVVKPGGIVIWHDYVNHAVDVTRALEHLRDDEGWPIVNVAGTWLAFMWIPQAA